MAKLSVVFNAVTSPLRSGLANAKSMISGFSMGIAGALAGVFGGVAYGITKIVGAGMKLESTRVQFEVLMGSAEKASATIKELRSFANITPFDTNSVIEASRALIATGSAGGVLMKELQMIGDVSSGTGKSIGDISAIYAKMKRMGRLTFEEINQLANSGALSMEELYKATGKSERSFRRYVESGRANFSIIKDIFEQSTSAGGRFYKMTEKMSQTAEGKLSTLQGKWQNLLADLGKDTSSPLTRIIDSLILGVETLGKWKALFDGIASAAESTAGAIENFTKKMSNDVSFTDSKGNKKTVSANVGWMDKAADLAASMPKTGMGHVNPFALLGTGMQMMGLGKENIAKREYANNEVAMGQADLEKMIYSLDKIVDNTSPIQTISPGGQ